jgi:hypothetical protein
MVSFVIEWEDFCLEECFFGFLLEFFRGTFKLSDFEGSFFCCSFKFSPLKVMSDEQFPFWFENTRGFSKKGVELFQMLKSEKADGNIERIVFKGKFFFKVGDEMLWSSGVLEEHFL